MADMRPALEQALRALRAARVSALHPDSVSLYTAAITRAEAALAQEEQKEQDARAEQIMSEIWAQPDQTYEYIGAKLAENTQKAMNNRARVSVEAVRSALAQEKQDVPETDCGNMESVGWLESPHGAFRANLLYRMTAPQSVAWSIPLYTHPPRREWVSLTDEEIKALLPGAVRVPPGWRETVAALEQALKEKNHG
jgi:hypothetical protein